MDIVESDSLCGFYVYWGLFTQFWEISPQCFTDI